MSTSFVCLVEERFTVMMIISVSHRCSTRRRGAVPVLWAELDDRSGWACLRSSDFSYRASTHPGDQRRRSRPRAAIRLLIEQGDASLIPRLEAIRANADRSIRQAIKPLMDLLKNRAKLTSPNTDVRRSAAADLGSSGIPRRFRGWSRPGEGAEQVGTLHDGGVCGADQARVGRSSDQSCGADKLGELGSQNAVPALKELVEAGDGAEATESQKTVAKAADAAIDRIETWGVWSNAIETFFRGVSLSSILLIMSLGLAIVFGLMGVINMAHGELMMVGAYATFVTQQCFAAWFSSDVFDWYFPAALPVSFLAAAGSGWVLEATVIRFLYGRPLETMLATWGVSLVLMQAARVYFGDLTAVIAPGPLRGGAQVMVGVYLPYNRIFIIALSIICVLGIYFALFKSNLGLRVRAVTQNRNMSACLGIPTRKVDSYTFAFGSGLAGIAGWALTMVGNVDPGLGQNYIVDAFMVVVTGGVGKLAGTIVASLGIGGLNKLIEPSLRRRVRQGLHPRAGDSVLAVAAVGTVCDEGTRCRLRTRESER